MKIAASISGYFFLLFPASPCVSHFPIQENSNPTFWVIQDWTQIDIHNPYKERSLCFLPHRVLPLRWNSGDISDWPAFPEYGTIGHRKVSSFSSFLNRVKKHIAMATYAIDFPGSPDPRSRRSRCISTQRNIHEGHRISRKPWSHDSVNSSFEPPFYILKLNPYLIKGSKIINKGTPVFHHEK